ncbi:hypothetical protein JD844_015316 [Phrynosoma platyrhinos]|uniref:Uncharacterized protein n=1 Tax=Phrynosoma platyrhinos TaxID=52577 RepID=A0ABQ7SIW9_PHRPL|nr:hypothetical protein JD844_015316 [Phrynosoma platyrhinos]
MEEGEEEEEEEEPVEDLALGGSSAGREEEEREGGRQTSSTAQEVEEEIIPPMSTSLWGDEDETVLPASTLDEDADRKDTSLPSSEWETSESAAPQDQGPSDMSSPPLESSEDPSSSSPAPTSPSTSPLSWKRRQLGLQGPKEDEEEDSEDKEGTWTDPSSSLPPQSYEEEQKKAKGKALAKKGALSRSPQGWAHTDTGARVGEAFGSPRAQGDQGSQEPRLLALWPGGSSPAFGMRGGISGRQVGLTGGGGTTDITDQGPGGLTSVLEGCPQSAFSLTGLYIGWRCPEYLWDCFRVGDESKCFCGHLLRQHQVYVGK